MSPARNSACLGVQIVTFPLSRNWKKYDTMATPGHSLMPSVGKSIWWCWVQLRYTIYRHLFSGQVILIHFDAWLYCANIFIRQLKDAPIAGGRNCSRKLIIPFYPYSIKSKRAPNSWRTGQFWNTWGCWLMWRKPSRSCGSIRPRWVWLIWIYYLVVECSNAWFCFEYVRGVVFSAQMWLLRC